MFRINPSYVFVIASYNNEANVDMNISSVAKQLYKNWRIIYINDASTDDTSNNLQKVVQKYKISDKITIIENEKNMKQAYSKYIAYQLVQDDEVVCILDGDDWLRSVHVLSILNKYYSQGRYHIVTSKFDIYENNKLNETGHRKYSKDIASNKHYRYANYSFGHLKTGLGIYFKSIPIKCLKMNDEWLDRCTDVAEMVCVSELCKDAKLISIQDVLYVYNKSNSIKYSNSWYHKNKERHNEIKRYICQQPKCKYNLPESYIIHIKDKFSLEANVYCQMDFIKPKKWAIHDACTPDKIQNIISMTENSQPISPVNDLHKKLFNLSKMNCTPPALSLVMSNIELFQKIQNEQPELDHVVVFEDDIYSLKSYQEHLFVNDKLLENKDIIYLGCHNKNSPIPIYNKNDSNIYVDIQNNEFLYYGTYALILSRKARQHILSCGINYFIENNLSYDIFLNYIRLIESNHSLTFYKYKYQLFIPDVLKDGIQKSRDMSFYRQRRIDTKQYYSTTSNITRL